MSDRALKIILITTPVDLAEKLGRQLVEKRLAACVNILPKVRSIYRWKDKIESTDEAMLIVKTTTDAVDKLTNYVIKNHPYDLPEILVLPIESGNNAYLDWINNEVAN